MKTKQYETWAVVDNQTMWLTDENHETAESAIEEMQEKGYTLEEMKENGFTCCRFSCEGNQWIECFEEISF